MKCLYFGLEFWKKVLLNINLIDRFFLSILNVVPAPSDPHNFWWESAVNLVGGVPCKWRAVSVLQFSRFSSCIQLSAFILSRVCLWIYLYLSYLEFVEISWICILMFFNAFVNISAIISLKKFSAPFSLSFPSDIPITHMLVYLMMPHLSLRFCSLFFILFYLCPSDCVISMLLTAQIYSCASVLNFSF